MTRGRPRRSWSRLTVGRGNAVAQDTGLDREALLRKLDEIRYEPPKEEGDDVDLGIGLGDSLRTLAHLGHEQQWQMCREVARQLLGVVPEPDDDDE